MSQLGQLLRYDVRSAQRKHASASNYKRAPQVYLDQREPTVVLAAGSYTGHVLRVRGPDILVAEGSETKRGSRRL